MFPSMSPSTLTLGVIGGVTSGYFQSIEFNLRSVVFSRWYIVPMKIFF
jgi:hypothetical protein